MPGTLPQSRAWNADPRAMVHDIAAAINRPRAFFS
jgi:hypothetical protein